MRPNILLITTDQQRYDHLGLKGVRGIDTPHLDRLGQEGVHFDCAYTPSPICTPARVSLLRGQYPSVHGAYSIGVTVDPFPRPTIADILREHAYRTALYGKAHFVARKYEAAHVAGEPDPAADFFREFEGPYLGFDHVRVSTGHTTNANPDMHYRVWLEEHGVDYSQWFPDVHGRHDHSATGPWNIPAEYHDTTWVAENTIEWISKHSQNPEEPWFCWASFQDPHEPFVCPEPWYSQVREEELQLSEGYREGEFDDKPAFYREALKNNWRRFQEEGGPGVPCISARGDDEASALRALRATLGMVAFIDDRVGAIMAALEQSGQADNTLVIFTSDHGELHGRHGLWHKGLAAYDDCQRVPLLVWGPGLVKKHGTTRALANLVDLPRTMLNIAGAPVPLGMQGADLSPILRGEKQEVQSETFVELQATQKIFQQTMVTDRYKLVLYRDMDDGELYDLQADPDQYVNLWNDPSAVEIKLNLLQQYAQGQMRKTGEQPKREYFA
jgi:arylsulfatase A-like enzyme